MNSSDYQRPEWHEWYTIWFKFLFHVIRVYPARCIFVRFKLLCNVIKIIHHTEAFRQGCIWVIQLLGMFYLYLPCVTYIDATLYPASDNE